jgi:hypothetical protein
VKCAQRRQLAEYEALLDRYGDRPEYARRVLAAELGARLARAAAEFWDEIAEREQGQLADGESRSAA